MSFLRNTVISNGLFGKPSCKNGFLNNTSNINQNINFIKITLQKRTLDRIQYKDHQHYENYPEGYEYKGEVPPLIEFISDDRQRAAPNHYPDISDFIVRKFFFWRLGCNYWIIWYCILTCSR